MSYTATFERIGRNRDVPPLEIADDETTDADEIAYHVYAFVRKHLASKDVVVVVNLETLTGSINGGRFGRFTLARAAQGHVAAEEAGE